MSWPASGEKTEHVEAEHEKLRNFYMDDDDLRRGLPTCHAKYGEAIAILAGDALLTRSFEVLATEITPSEIAVRCVSDLGQAAGASALVGGQVDDLSAEFSKVYTELFAFE